MSLLPAGASLEELVQDCFLAYRGCGVALSALDEELLSQWARSGAPLEVIAMGIRRAAEKAAWHARPGEPALRSLRACRRQVESEIRRHQWRSAGTTGEARPPRESRSAAKVRRQMQSALQHLASERPELSEQINQLASLIARDTSEAEDFRERFDLAEARLLRALAFPERIELLKKARAQTNGSIEQASSRARRLSRRFHRGVVLRKQLGLPAFW
jgi:predicted RNase H-like nuclease (RuvC/YqgF family)